MKEIQITNINYLHNGEDNFNGCWVPGISCFTGTDYSKIKWY